MADFRIAPATADDMVRFRDWADDLCWNPGEEDDANVLVRRLEYGHNVDGLGQLQRSD